MLLATSPRTPVLRNASNLNAPSISTLSTERRHTKRLMRNWDCYFSCNVVALHFSANLFGPVTRRKSYHGGHPNFLWECKKSNL
jgi:hypothetical protein